MSDKQASLIGGRRLARNVLRNLLGTWAPLLVAEKLGKRQDDEIISLIWTAISLMAVLGVLGAIIDAVLSSWLVQQSGGHGVE